jgi:hypothetical protein
LLKKLKISSQDIYPAASEHLSEFFSIVKNSDTGSFIVFFGSQFYIRGWWWLAVGLNSLYIHEVCSVGIFFRLCLSLNIVPSRVYPLLTAFCLFTKTFVRLVLLVLLVYVRRSLAYKYPSGVLLWSIKCLVV